MLQRKGSQYELYPFKVKYINNEEPIEQWALPDKEWWTAFSEKWDHVSDLEFEEVEVTEHMLKRYEEIKDMPEDFADIYTEYVLTGNTPDELPMQQGHPFRVLLLTNDNRILKIENTKIKAQNQALADQAEFHTDVITEIILSITP